MNLQEHQSLLLVLGLALVGFWFLNRINRRRGTGSQAPLTAEEQIERLRESKGMQSDLEKLMAEIDDLAKRLGQRLDAKTAQVERLLAEADRKIAQLQRLEGQAAAREPLPRVETNRSALPDDPLARSVYELADAGYPALDIARRLNEQVGKVELILALRKA